MGGGRGSVPCFNFSHLPLLECEPSLPNAVQCHQKITSFAFFFDLSVYDSHENMYATHVVGSLNVSTEYTGSGPRTMEATRGNGYAPVRGVMMMMIPAPDPTQD